MAAEFAYFFGFPRRQWHYAAAMIGLAGLMAFFSIFALMGAWHEASWPWMALKGGVAAFAGWACWDFLRSIFSGSIVPYFDRRIDGIGTFAQGAAVARNCRRLDELAAEKGATPLSAFGFADDLRGETVVWHEPRAGIETISALLEALGSDAADRRLVDELAAIRDALQAAARKGARFSLILHRGMGSNHREHALRAGSFF